MGCRPVEAGFSGIKSIPLCCRTQKQELNVLKANLKKLQDAASIVELRNKAEAATAWRVVQLTQAEVDKMKEKLEVRGRERADVVLTLSGV
jgi:outer membrane protein TolC